MLSKLKKLFITKTKDKSPQITKQRLWLTKFNINTFIDIGAYMGEYIDYARQWFPQASIYAFEPLDDCFKKLVKKTETLKRVNVYNFALGDKNGPSIIYRSSYAPSSSLLQMTDLHKKAFPISSGSTKQRIQVKTLDSVFQNMHLKPNIFIKMDTQGYEDKIIKGGKLLIGRTAIIQMEVSFTELYWNQPLFHDIYMQLYGMGFAFHGIHNQVLTPNDGDILQAHAYFVNRAKAKSAKKYEY